MDWIDVEELGLGPSGDDLRMLASGEPPAGPWARKRLEPNYIPYQHICICDIQAVRARLYLCQDINVVRPFLDAAVRFCEVNMWRLMKRMCEVWGRRAAGSAAVLTGACLLEGFLVDRDARFLGTVLKIVETPLFPSQRRIQAEDREILLLAGVVKEQCIATLSSLRLS